LTGWKSLPLVWVSNTNFIHSGVSVKANAPLGNKKEMCNLMEVFMKTRFAIIGIVIVLAVSLLTCDLDLPGKGGGEEDLDWEFVENPDGTAQLTLWLDGSKPVKATTQTRALNLGIAKRSHDLFEAIFTTDTVVARSSWEVGQAAGIRGVPRGQAYYGLSAPSTTLGNSIVLVGRKAGNGEGTLLGVGFMTHVNGTLITTPASGIIASTTRNVTFTVSALSTRIGYDFAIDETLTTQSWASPVTGTEILLAYPNYPTRDTFYTAANDPVSGGGTASFGNTQIGTATFRNNATYSMFGLPKYNAAAANHVIASSGPPAVAAHNVVNATYKVGGLSAADTAIGIAADTLLSGTVHGTTGVNLAGTLFVADCGVDADFPNFQVIERLAIYQTLGQTYDVIEADLDTYTTVVPHTDYVFTDGAAFDPEIKLQFNIFKDSGGAFAFTFQVPVYGLVHNTGLSVPSTNGGPEAIAWYIRPAHGQAQYLLDNGYSASGGAVLVGVGVGSLDWLSIIVRGFGFTNTPYQPPATP
jgi:hypothetical protein